MIRTISEFELDRACRGALRNGHRPDEWLAGCIAASRGCLLGCPWRCRGGGQYLGLGGTGGESRRAGRIDFRECGNGRRETHGLDHRLGRRRRLSRRPARSQCRLTLRRKPRASHWRKALEEGLMGLKLGLHQVWARIAPSPAIDVRVRACYQRCSAAAAAGGGTIFALLSMSARTG